MSVTVTVDTKQFEQALEEYVKQSKRDSIEVINKACVDIIIKSAQLTPVATQKKIKSELFKLYPNTRTKGGKTYSQQSELVYLLAAKKTKGLNNSAMSAAANKIINVRLASAGYIAYAGWNNALQALGGRGFGSKMARKPPGVTHSNADSGFGIKATISLAAAMLVNCATGAAKIGAEPFQRVMNSKALDMVNHIFDKMSAQADKQRAS